MARQYRPELELDGYILMEQGYVAYPILERIAICMESGMSYRDALRVAREDSARDLARDQWYPGKR